MYAMPTVALEAHYLDTQQAAHYLGYTSATLHWWRSDCRGPRYYQMGRRVRSKKSDLDNFFKAGLVEPWRAR